MEKKDLEAIINSGKQVMQMGQLQGEFSKNSSISIVPEVAKLKGYEDFLEKFPAQYAQSLSAAENKQLLEMAVGQSQKKLIDFTSPYYRDVVGVLGSDEKRGYDYIVQLLGQAPPVEYEGVNEEALKAHGRYYELIQLQQKNPEKFAEALFGDLLKSYEKIDPWLAAAASLVAKKNPELLQSVAQHQIITIIDETKKAFGRVNGASGYLTSLYEHVDEKHKSALALHLGMALTQYELQKEEEKKKEKEGNGEEEKEGNGKKSEKKK